MHEIQKVRKNKGAITPHGTKFDPKGGAITPHEMRLREILVREVYIMPPKRRINWEGVFIISLFLAFALPVMLIVISIFTGKHSVDSPIIGAFMAACMVNAIVCVVSFFMIPPPSS